MTRWLQVSIAVIFALGLGFAAGAARADDPAFISFGVGAYDFNKRREEGAEFRLEYRSDYKVPYVQFKPFAAVAGTTTSQYFFSAGVLWDLFFGDRIVVTPSFAPGYYTGGDRDDGGLDLDHPFEFRSQLEVAYRFDNRSRLGLAISHYSNASLGDKNPGTETAMVYYSLPITTFIGD
ncbi:MAG TPA: acyloxyacyl hydrolase [Rhodospirillales bacterium]|nr:acyloxyacyl hydrolase [Rhodospirillales bacterium]